MKHVIAATMTAMMSFLTITGVLMSNNILTGLLWLTLTFQHVDFYKRDKEEGRS